jgi:regulator of telomere elongation helicase 1
MESLYETRESAAEFSQNGDTTRPDFSAEELCILKTMFLELEKAVDDIPVESGGSTFHGSFIIDILAKAEVCNEIKVLNNWKYPPIHPLLHHRR